MEEYKPNSYKYKEEQKENNIAEKKVEKVIKGVAKTKKKNGIQNFLSSFISEDAKDIKSHIIEDVIIPTIKDTLMDTLGMLLGIGGRRGGSKKSNSDKMSYSQYYYNGRTSSGTVKAQTRFDFDDIIFESRADAEAVIDKMIDIIDKYGVASVADLYDTADLTAPFTSNRYGWTNFRSADVVRVRDGYIINLPTIKVLD